MRTSFRISFYWSFFDASITSNLLSISLIFSLRGFSTCKVNDLAAFFATTLSLRLQHCIHDKQTMVMLQTMRSLQQKYTNIDFLLVFDENFYKGLFEGMDLKENPCKPNSLTL